MVDPTGRLITGPSLKEAVEAVDEQAGDARPDFYSINCAHPVEFESALVGGPWLERLRGLRNLGRPPQRHRAAAALSRPGMRTEVSGLGNRVDELADALFRGPCIPTWSMGCSDECPYLPRVHNVERIAALVEEFDRS